MESMNCALQKKGVPSSSTNLGTVKLVNAAGLWISSTQASSSSRNNCQRVWPWVVPAAGLLKGRFVSRDRAHHIILYGRVRIGASGGLLWSRRPRRCRRCRFHSHPPLLRIIGEGILAVGHPVAVGIRRPAWHRLWADGDGLRRLTRPIPPPGCRAPGLSRRTAQPPPSCATGWRPPYREHTTTPVIAVLEAVPVGVTGQRC